MKHIKHEEREEHKADKAIKAIKAFFLFRLVVQHKVNIFKIPNINYRKNKYLKAKRCLFPWSPAQAEYNSISISVVKCIGGSPLFCLLEIHMTSCLSS